MPKKPPPVTTAIDDARVEVAGSRRSEQPAWVCAYCGARWGRRGPSAWSTFHHGTCGVCGAEAAVTEPRDYGYLRDGWQAARSAS